MPICASRSSYGGKLRIRRWRAGGSSLHRPSGFVHLSRLLSGHMSNSVTAEPRRQLDGRPPDRVERLVDAAVEELRDSGYDGLTVRNVARRAGLAPATAYNYF